MNSTVERLDKLETELEALLGSPVWMDGFKRQVLKQVQDIFMDYGQRDVLEKIGCMNDLLYCSKRKYCMNAIMSKIESAGLAYLNSNGERTIQILDELRCQVEDGSSDCESGDCRTYVISIVNEIRTVFKIAIRIENEIGSISMTHVGEGSLNPQDVSDVLIPLSHPARLAILFKLEQGRMGFSEISNETGLRTGHLQFHLRALEECDFVRREHKGGKYGLSLRGITAMSGLRSLMTELGNNGHEDDCIAVDRTPIAQIDGCKL
jgi:DNA-binding transcriptional ArsR family regulator